MQIHTTTMQTSPPLSGYHVWSAHAPTVNNGGHRHLCQHCDQLTRTQTAGVRQQTNYLFKLGKEIRLVRYFNWNVKNSKKIR